MAKELRRRKQALRLAMDWIGGLIDSRTIWRTGIGVAALAFALTGCASDPVVYQAPPPVQTSPAALPRAAAIEARPIATAGTTGTFVGAKVLQLRGDLETMQRGLASHSQRLRELQITTTDTAERYHGRVAAINAKLQVGTTRGNPLLTAQLTEAQSELNRIDADLAQLAGLAGQVSTDSALAGYLLEAVRAAYNLSGAVDEDHRNLVVLEDEVNRTVILIDRLLSEINTDVTRQTAYVATERRNLQTLALAVKNGEPFGGNLGFYTGAARPLTAADPRVRPGASAAASRPLVVIRFDRPTVDYVQPLYRAISEALQRRPSTSFEIEAAAPTTAASTVSARRQADRVTRSLIEMGVPRDRLYVSERIAPQARTDEVRIYVR